MIDSSFTGSGVTHHRLSNNSSPFHALHKPRLHSPLPIISSTHRFHSPLPRELGSSSLAPQSTISPSHQQHNIGTLTQSPQSGFRSLASASPALPLQSYLHHPTTSSLISSSYKSSGLAGLHSNSLSDLHAHTQQQQQGGGSTSSVATTHPSAGSSLLHHSSAVQSHPSDTQPPLHPTIDHSVDKMSASAINQPTIQCPHCNMQLVLGRPSQLVACPRCLQVFDPHAHRNAICVGCNAQLAYPSTAQFIQCPKCNTTMKAPDVSGDIHSAAAASSHSPNPTDVTGSPDVPSMHQMNTPHSLMMMSNLPQMNHQISASSAGSGTHARTSPSRHAKGGRGSNDHHRASKAAPPPPAESHSPTSSSTSKKRKDQNAPKAVVNAYMIFCKMRRNELKKKYPELPFGKIGAKLGEIWRQMSIAEKKPYEDRATLDRERYRKEMMDYATVRGSDHVEPPPSRKSKDEVLYQAFDDDEIDQRSSETLHHTIAQETGDTSVLHHTHTHHEGDAEQGEGNTNGNDYVSADDHYARQQEEDEDEEQSLNRDDLPYDEQQPARKQLKTQNQHAATPFESIQRQEATSPPSPTYYNSLMKNEDRPSSRLESPSEVLHAAPSTSTSPRNFASEVDTTTNALSPTTGSGVATSSTSPPHAQTPTPIDTTTTATVTDEQPQSTVTPSAAESKTEDITQAAAESEGTGGGTADSTSDIKSTTPAAAGATPTATATSPNKTARPSPMTSSVNALLFAANLDKL